MKTIIQNMEMTRGDTFSGFEFGIENDAGETLQLDAAYFSCKTDPDAEDYIFQKSIGDGIARGSDGMYRLKVPASDTDDVVLGRYYYDLEITLQGDTFTPMKGRLNLTFDVTRGSAQ